MAVVGTTIFSHIIPIVLGFFGVLYIASGIMDDKKSKLILGIFLFVTAAILPFIVLRAFLL